ncbi:hypothetical protein ACKGJY_07430 [Hyunsoonleella sp. 2307UL5-6]|uniref:hypothetical protein n=1 Tax=Hyunsoonleella sp. 2307UL5-6 TaxID=3384768 RepID=UPI0039BD140F
MKRLLSLNILLFSFIGLTAHANLLNAYNTNKNNISGKILDVKSKPPLPYVNVIIKNSKRETLT